MIQLTVREIAQITDGRVVSGDPDTVVTGTVEFDSRKVTPGGLFVAFAGEHVDGHDYIDAAVAAGAVATLATDPTRAGAGGATAAIVVADALDALAKLAAAVVRRLPATVVVGVTGSSGKTSTKDLLAQVLATAGTTVAPPGSFNNELGHPYTVLRADTGTRFLVLENSARGVGHIAYLCRIAPPRIAAVLNVGSAHLGEFGSREAIAQAKGELVEALPAADEGGMAVLNADDPLVIGMAPRTSARVVTFGVSAEADVHATDVRLDELGRAAFTLVAAGERAPVALRLVGAHHVSNALATAAIALECGLTVPDVAAALSAAGPVSRWRMEVTERADGLMVINDAYNANPESVRAALETLARVDAARDGASWAVLGPMAELGEAADAEHEAVGRLAAQLGVAHVVAVGEPARPIVSGTALEGSWGGEARWVPDTAAAAALVQAEAAPGDAVLVKASRSAGLEHVAAALTGEERHG
ncbi:UDP-N-acetylmuramoyl-tripeptide--D-alanyl-D-alanine ligase [Jatrophihabitans fulvus]